MDKKLVRGKPRKKQGLTEERLPHGMSVEERREMAKPQTQNQKT